MSLSFMMSWHPHSLIIIIGTRKGLACCKLLKQIIEGPKAAPLVALTGELCFQSYMAVVFSVMLCQSHRVALLSSVFM
jgi:hypothetical protein